MSHLIDSPVIRACMLAAGLLMRHNQIEDSGLSSWFRYKGLQPELYNCPVVSKGFYDYQDGNFECRDNIEPVGVHVVPYNGNNYPKANSLQVLTTDVAVFKPNMD